MLAVLVEADAGLPDEADGGTATMEMPGQRIAAYLK